MHPMSKTTVMMILACTLISSAAVIGGAWTLSRFMLKVQRTTEHCITVKGVAEKTVKSDIGTLTCRIIVKAPGTAAGYEGLNRANTVFHAKLLRLGFTPKEEEQVELSHCRVTRTVRTREGNRETVREEFSHYEFSRSCRLRSTDVDKIAAAAQDLYELIPAGVEIRINAPQYFISNPEQYKLELIDSATRAGHLRAALAAGSCGGKLGSLLTARQGVIQITRPADNQSSDGGVYDTSSIDKIIRMVVTLKFSLK